MDTDIISLVSLHETGAVIIRTTIIFLYAFCLLRLLGKRRLSLFGYIDVLLIIAFGSAVGDVMIYGESTAHLINSMVAVTVVAVLVKLINEFSSHSSLGARVFDGHARLVIDKGKIVDGVLAKEDMTEDRLCSYLRQKGIDSVRHVRKGFLEPDGELSVIPYRAKRTRK
jgi:uncharacterized membrane protein YcaP (DUF421 family)